MYRHLDGKRIEKTIARLHDRIVERFPESSLGNVARELRDVSDQAVGLARRLRRPNWVLRGLIVVLLLVIVWLLVAAVPEFKVKVEDRLSMSALIGMIESTLGSIVFIGAAVLFLWTLEGRLNRTRALRAFHELRSLAHVVDMHQLTKDPERLLSSGPSTKSSPVRTMSAFELGRYFDYCSELLSLIGKLGAFHAEDLDDPVVLAAVDQIETLTTGLARKIWQKIMILEKIEGRA